MNTIESAWDLVRAQLMLGVITISLADLILVTVTPYLSDAWASAYLATVILA